MARDENVSHRAKGELTRKEYFQAIFYQILVIMYQMYILNVLCYKCLTIYSHDHKIQYK